MILHPIPTHAGLPDMPSATNSDHDGRYLNLDGEATDVTDGTFDLTTTGNIKANVLTITRILAGGVTE